MYSHLIAPSGFQGCHSGPPVDSWDDADLSCYKVNDRLLFCCESSGHPHPLPLSWEGLPFVESPLEAGPFS